MALSLTDILNQWAELGVFSYVLPFLIVFAVVFAVLQKSKIFASRGADGNITQEQKGINVVISVSVALLSLLNDFVPTFFASIIPKFGIALVILLVMLIIMGFATPGEEFKGNKWLGWILFGIVVFWAWMNWSSFVGYGYYGGFDLGYFLQEYLGGLIVLGGVIAIIVYFAKK